MGVDPLVAFRGAQHSMAFAHSELSLYILFALLPYCMAALVVIKAFRADWET